MATPDNIMQLELAFGMISRANTISQLTRVYDMWKEFYADFPRFKEACSNRKIEILRG